MKDNIKLSYVLTTFNKFQYLKVTLDALIQNLEEDEEIVISDGGSTDGTVAFLEDLFQRKLIHQFVSERDFGEANGFNKGMLMAKGELIKLLSDDDVYFFPGITACKNHMLNNPKIQLLNSNGGWVDIKSNRVDEFTQIYEKFFLEKWVTEKHPFAHCGLGLMFRRDALSLLGLIGVGFYRADAEYTLKITAQKKLNFVWYTGINYVRVLNEDSNSFIYKERIQAETQRLNAFYGFDIDKIYFPEVKKEGLAYLAHWILRIPKGIIRRMMPGKQKVQQNSGTVSLNFSETFTSSVSWLASINQRQRKFLAE